MSLDLRFILGRMNRIVLEEEPLDFLKLFFIYVIKTNRSSLTVILPTHLDI